MQTENPKSSLTKAEIELIKAIRSLDFGEIRIIIKDKRPIRIEEIRKSIQLSGDKQNIDSTVRTDGRTEVRNKG